MAGLRLIRARGISCALCGAAILTVLGCAEADREKAAAQAAWPEIDALYLETVYDLGPLAFAAGADREEREAELWARMPLETISLTSGGCYGSCPIYEVTFHRGGAAHFSGDSFVGALEGEFEGTIDIRQFARLCLFIDRFRFRDLEPEYSAPWTDDNTITIRVTPVDAAVPIVVSDYGEQAPPEFLMLQLAVEHLVRRIEWE